MTTCSGSWTPPKEGRTSGTSPVRVSPLLALDAYEGDLDFGTNYMGVDTGGTPNIFETEIHGGLYRGTLLIELDAVGNSRIGEGISATEISKPWDVPAAEKYRRVAALLSSLQHLWSSGRQSRFLADISPKFVAAAVLTAKVPLFLESVTVRREGTSAEASIDVAPLTESLQDAKEIKVAHCFGVRSGLFRQVPEGCLTIGQAFETAHGWVKDHYGA